VPCFYVFSKNELVSSHYSANKEMEIAPQDILEVAKATKVDLL
jgi:hypothetical protein